MTDVLLAASFDRTISLEEFRTRVSEILYFHGMQVATQLSCHHDWIPDTRDARRLINSVNLSLLAKAFALWGNTAGRPMKITHDDPSEEFWFLRAANSLPWYSKEQLECDLNQTMIAFLVRQAYLVYVVNDPIDGLIARNFMMFHQLAKEVDLPVKDINGEFARVFGIELDEFWAVMFAVYTFYFMLVKIDPSKWVLSPNLFSDTPRNDHWNGLLASILRKLGRTQKELCDLYATDGKYRDASSRVGSWVSEFNILRDFPFVEFAPDKYCSPFPVFAIRRAIPGFYYDLLEDYADQERKRGNNQPYRNQMRMSFQLLFQRYVGLQLEQLCDADECLSAEFSYGKKGDKANSPDWILCRANTLPVFFECKARQPALAWQSGGTPDQINNDIRQTLTHALQQVTKFLRRVDAKDIGTERFHGLTTIIYALVMHDPFPFHAIPDLADRIDQIAYTDIPNWGDFKDRINFVPMSIRELETAIGLELQRSIPLEQQLKRYAEYRSGVTERFIVKSGTIQFPRHLEEFLQEEFNNSQRIENPLIQKAWNQFTNFVSEQMYDESCTAYEESLRVEWIQENAYFRWVDEDYPHDQHERHWQEAVAEYQALEQQLGEAPWAVDRLARYRRTE